MKFTGERVVIDDMRQMPTVLQDHIARYNFALAYVVDKKVLDAACGSGYGVDLMSQLASQVDGCDIDAGSLGYAKDKYPKHTFFVQDLNSIDITAHYDVITSFETIEHLDNPDVFLEWASKRCDTFVFSIPVNMPSEFHKQVWDIPQIKALMTKYFPNTEFYSQIRMNFYSLGNEATYVVGVGRK